MRKMLEKIKAVNKKLTALKKEKLKGKGLILFVVAYFILVGSFMLVHNMWLSPDQFIIVGFLLTLIVAQPILFLKDWVPFVFLFLSYEFLRGLAPFLGIKAHFLPMIDADRFLFGHLPTVSLQNHLYTPGNLHFYDYIATIIYMMHFILPLVFGFFLWLYKRKEFQKFVITLLALSYLGFLTFMLFPAAPPWMASNQGMIPKIYNVFGDTFSTFVHGTHLPSVYQLFDPNPVAAMPSLHAAYPFLVYLFIVKIFGKYGHLFLIYVATVCFAVIYTGNHYVIDVIFGFIYAYVAFRGIDWLWPKFENRKDGQLKKEATAASKIVT